MGNTQPQPQTQTLPPTPPPIKLVTSSLDKNRKNVK